MTTPTEETGKKLTDFPRDIQRAASESPALRTWALAHAAAIVFSGDPEADPIFAKLAGPERMLLGRCIARAALVALDALETALKDNPNG